MKHIIYISSFFPKNSIDFYNKNIKNCNPYSATTFSYSIFRGLVENFDKKTLSVINVPPVGYYPRFFSRPRITRNVECFQGQSIVSIALSTIYLFQYKSIELSVVKELQNYPINEDTVILVYSISIPVIRALKKIKEKKNFKSVLIIPDFLEDTFDNSLKSKIKKKLLGVNGNLYGLFDGFVYLTKYMNERTKSSKPCCVVEGIFNSDCNDPGDLSSIEVGGKYIMYSGMLYEKFGVKDLIDAFVDIQNPDIKLVLCGTGDLKDYILKQSNRDNRICYLGVIPRNDVLSLQRNAYLLVNPRQPVGNFTRYSFPSKNMEYLASGKPTLLYQLPGIPAEYYDYCYNIPNDRLGKDYLKEMIEYILSEENKTKNMDLAVKAKQFILGNKNAYAQCNKIKVLIDKL